MNLNTLNISVVPCAVCDYPFSDKHHIWPQSKGGKSLPTVALCPNHHRFANLIQAMVFKAMQRAQIESFAHRYFDPVFNAAMLDFLISEQERLSALGWAAYAEQREQEARADPHRALSMAGAFLREQRMRMKSIHPDELIPAADLQEALAHIRASWAAWETLE